MNQWADKRVLVTGGSAGLGLALARGFCERGARVAVVGRTKATLEAAAESLQPAPGKCIVIQGDVTSASDCARIFTETKQQLGGLDVLVNNAGRSSRGTIADTSPEEFRALWELNFLATLQCTQLALPMLLESQGHVVNIGSLGAKSASKFLGAYPASKFPVAALSQQLRLEHSSSDLHVLLVCPGPLTRQDAGTRYASQVEGLPETAAAPGGGVKVSTIDPAWLTDQIISACERRKVELVVPRKARLLFALAQLFPSWGDRILQRMTSR